jgi:hypothetical protein
VATVTLGNVSHTALMSDPDTGVRTRYASTNIVRSTTTMHLPEPNLRGQLNSVANLWHHESDRPPAWVESDSEILTLALRDEFDCGGRPDDWENDITGPPATVAIDERAAQQAAAAGEAETESSIGVTAADVADLTSLGAQEPATDA